MRLRWFIPVILLIILSCSIYASPLLDVKEYVALRKKHSANASIKSAQADAAGYIGRVIEIRGRVAGLSGNDGNKNIIITTPNDGSYIIDAESASTDCVGAEVACLAKVGDKSTSSLSDLHLVALTYNAILQRTEAEWQRSASAKAAKIKASQNRQSSPKIAHTALSGKSYNGKKMTVDEITRIYKNAIKGFNGKLSDQQADTIARSVLGFSAHYKVDPRLVCAVILAESNFKIEATSGCGAQGLGQLMPGTAAGMGVDNAYDPVQNVYGSVRYIKSMLERVAGKSEWNELTWYDLSLAIAAYNAGPGAVKKHGGIPPYAETQNYVRKVTAIYKKLCGVTD